MAFNYKIFLASKSPRRRELVKEIFNNISILDVVGDEPRWSIKESPKAYLSTCLDFKWNLASQSFRQQNPSDRSLEGFKTPAPQGFLIADTIVVLGNKVLGKPINAREAEQMLRELSGRTHQVRTGMRLGYQVNGVLKSEERIVETEVRFHKLNAAEIKAYVKTGSPMDKAGAYGFQDQALKFVASIKGSYLNVVGLPLLELRSAAEALGWK